MLGDGGDPTPRFFFYTPGFSKHGCEKKPVPPRCFFGANPKKNCPVYRFIGLIRPINLRRRFGICLSHGVRIKCCEPTLKSEDGGGGGGTIFYYESGTAALMRLSVYVRFLLSKGPAKFIGHK
jgi:hypothetical protein